MRRADRSSKASFDQRVEEQQIAGAAIDAFDIEPLPPSHPFGRWTTYWHTAYRLRITWSLQDFYEDTGLDIRGGSTRKSENGVLMKIILIGANGRSAN